MSLLLALSLAINFSGSLLCQAMVVGAGDVHQKLPVRHWANTINRAVRRLVVGRRVREHSLKTAQASSRRRVFRARFGASTGAWIVRILRAALIDLPPPRLAY